MGRHAEAGPKPVTICENTVMPTDLWNVRTTISAALLVDFAMVRGLTKPQALHGTGISEADLTDPAVEIDIDQEFGIIGNILDAVGDQPGLGLLAGMTYHLPVLGALGIAMSTCPTVRDMAETWTRYPSLSYVYARYRLEDDGQRVLCSMATDHLPARVRRFAMERDLVAMRTLQRDLLKSDVIVRRLEVDLEPRTVYEAVGLLLGIPEIVFDAPRTILIFDAVDMKRPMPLANPVIRAQAEQMCLDTLRARADQAETSAAEAGFSSSGC